MSPIPLPPAELAGLIVETVFFGMYLVTFTASIYVLLFQRSTSQYRPTKPLTLISMLIFLCVLTHWILDISRAFEAFIHHRLGDPAVYYADLSQGLNVAKATCYILETIVADVVLVCRLYHICPLRYQTKIKICILPACTTIGIFVAGIMVIYHFATNEPVVHIFTSRFRPWITIYFVATLFTNVYSSLVIAYWVWRRNESMKTFTVTPSPLPPVLNYIIESAAIYTMCTSYTFIAYLCGSNIQFPGVNAGSPVIGFVFSLIIVRTRFQDPLRTSTSMSAVSDSLPSPIFAKSDTNCLRVKISHEVQVKRDTCDCASVIGDGETEVSAETI